jgi:hypothetical protein
MKQNSFLFMTSWEDSIKLLTDSEKGQFLTNLIHYHNGDKLFIKLDTPMLKMFWMSIEPTLKVNREKYLNKINIQKSHNEIASHIQNKFFKK